MISGSLFDRLRSLQQMIREAGLAASQLALPAPRLLLLPSSSSADSKEEILFSQVVVEDEIVDVCRDLFESGFYNQAVCEAYKALNLFIQQRIADKSLSDTKLMNEVFSPNNPKLVWSGRKNPSEIDEHRGYHFLFSGAFTGIRNPCTHEIDWIDDHREALDAILIAQHLLRRAKAASVAAKGGP